MTTATGRLVMVWPILDQDRTFTQLRDEATTLLAESLAAQKLRPAGPADFRVTCDVDPQLVATVAVAPEPPPRTAGNERPLVPCGTRSAAVRHMARGEEVDAFCQAAFREYERSRAKRRRAAQKVAA